MKKHFPLLLLVAVLLSSCSAIYTYRESTARYVEPTRAGFITPVVADMKISPTKISYTTKFENTLRKRDVISIMNDVNNNRDAGIVLSWKKNTMAAALKLHQADDIVTPTFEITPSEDLKYITDIMPDADADFKKFEGRYFSTPKKMGAQTAEANTNAGLAAANQIVGFIKEGITKFQVNK